MNRPVHLGVALVLGAASALFVPATGAPAAQVLVRNDLGTPPGDSSVARVINAGGVIAGDRNPGAGSTSRAFRWTSGTGMVDLGTLGGSSSVARGINDAGEIMGSSTTGAGASHGYVWDSTHGMVDLGTLGTGTVTTPNAISANGTVVGAANVNASAQHPFLWTRAGGIVDLGTLGGTNARATAVNASGTVVGTSESTVGNSTTHAFSWDAVNGMVDLGTLGGSLSEAHVINDAGQIAGIAWAATGPTRFYRKDPGQPMTDLGRTAAFAVAATGISPAGRVSGWGFGTFEFAHAIVAAPGTSLVEVDATPTTSVAHGTSPDGTTVFGSSDLAPFLWQPGRGVRLLDVPSQDADVLGLNDAGVAVGFVASGGRHVAARWVPQAGIVASVGNASVVEGDEAGSKRIVKFSVTLSAPSTQLVKIPFTIDRSYTQTAAVSQGPTPDDYVEKGGIITFTPGGGGLTPTTKFAMVSTKGDVLSEPTETYVIRLGTPTAGNAALGVSVQTASILDNDPSPAAPTVSVGDASAWEGDSGTGRTVQVPLTLNHAGGVPTTVRVTVSNSTATSPADYKAFTKIVKFSATARQAYVTIKLTTDTVAEPDRTIAVTVSSPTGGLAIGRIAGVATILDDDHP